MDDGGSSEVVSQNVNEPWSVQKPFLADIFNLAKQSYYDPESRIAPVSDATQWGQNTNLDYAVNAINPMMDATNAAHRYLLSGDVMSAEANPYLQSYMEAAIRPIFGNLQQNVLPGIESQYLLAGQPGSTRHGISQGLAIGGATQQAMDTTSRMASDAYNRGLDAYMQSIQWSPSIAAFNLLPGEIAQNVGRQQEAYEQAKLSEQDTRLANYLAMVSGNLGGTQTITNQGAQGPGAAQGAIGGAMVGYQSTGSWYGALIGAILGGVAGDS